MRRPASELWELTGDAVNILGKRHADGAEADTAAAAEGTSDGHSTQVRRP